MRAATIGSDAMHGIGWLSLLKAVPCLSNQEGYWGFRCHGMHHSSMVSCLVLNSNWARASASLQCKRWGLAKARCGAQLGEWLTLSMHVIVSVTRRSCPCARVTGHPRGFSGRLRSRAGLLPCAPEQQRNQERVRTIGDRENTRTKPVRWVDVDQTADA